MRRSYPPEEGAHMAIRKWQGSYVLVWVWWTFFWLFKKQHFVSFFSPSCSSKQYLPAPSIFVVTSWLTGKKNCWKNRIQLSQTQSKMVANLSQERILSFDQTTCLLLSKEQFLWLIPSPVPFLAQKWHWGCASTSLNGNFGAVRVKPMQEIWVFLLG